MRLARFFISFGCQTPGLSAIPNEAPIMTLVNGEPASCPPMLKISSMPNPTYAPASIEATKYPSGFFFRNAAFAFAAPAAAEKSSKYIDALLSAMFICSIPVIFTADNSNEVYSIIIYKKQFEASKSKNKH